ncbi:hypothetical protein MTO96_012950 [Rhipicephalus appendiculatus]
MEPCRHISTFSDCIILTPNGAAQHVYYMFSKTAPLQSIVVHEFRERSIRRIPSDRCAALFDLDMDNWDETWTCQGFELPYRYLTHFHASIEGHSSPMDQLHRC